MKYPVPAPCHGAVRATCTREGCHYLVLDRADCEPDLPTVLNNDTRWALVREDSSSSLPMFVVDWLGTLSDQLTYFRAFGDARFEWFELPNDAADRLIMAVIMSRDLTPARWCRFVEEGFGS